MTNGGHDGNGEQPLRPGDDGEPELDIDSAFAAIVAGWGDDDAGSQPGSWPVAEDVDTPGGAAGSPTALPASPVQPGAPGEGAAAREDATRKDAAREDDRTEEDGPGRPGDRPDGDPVLPAIVLGGGSLTSSTIGPRDSDPNAPAPAEEGFVPPEPPPIPRGDLMTRLLWGGAIGGPLFLLVAAIAWRDAPRMLILAAVAAFVGGFVMLVVRMPHDREDDDDDGAVV
jgi:hypothetical protein